MEQLRLLLSDVNTALTTLPWREMRYSKTALATKLFSALSLSMSRRSAVRAKRQGRQRRRRSSASPLGLLLCVLPYCDVAAAGREPCPDATYTQLAATLSAVSPQARVLAELLLPLRSHYTRRTCGRLQLDEGSVVFWIKAPLHDSSHPTHTSSAAPNADESAEDDPPVTGLANALWWAEYCSGVPVLLEGCHDAEDWPVILTELLPAHRLLRRVTVVDAWVMTTHVCSCVATMSRRQREKRARAESLPPLPPPRAPSAHLAKCDSSIAAHDGSDGEVLEAPPPQHPRDSLPHCHRTLLCALLQTDLLPNVTQLRVEVAGGASGAAGTVKRALTSATSNRTDCTPRIADITVRNCFALSEVPAFTAVGCPLRTLTLVGCTSLTTLCDFTSCTALAEVTCVHCDRLRDVAGVYAAPHLHKLAIRACAVTTVDGMHGCAALVELDVSHNNALTSLAGVAGAPMLETLTAVHTALCDIAGLCRCPRLAHVNLSHSRALMSVDGLAGAPRLVSLDVRHTPAQDVWRLRQTCPALREVLHGGIGQPQAPRYAASASNATRRGTTRGGRGGGRGSRCLFS